MKAIVITCDNDAYTVDYPDNVNVMEYNELKYLISHLPHPFSWFEIVTVKIDDMIIQMYVDEEGKMKDNWPSRINDGASVLYANPYDCIVGDVVLLLDKHDADSHLFTDEQADAIMEYLCV